MTTYPPATDAPATITLVPLSLIVAGKNDRTDFDTAATQEHVAGLAASIAEIGLAQPITVRPIGGMIEAYEIVCGECRFRAVSSLHWDAIPAIVRDLTDTEAADLMLVENTGRKDLNPVDEANAYAKAAALGRTVKEVAERAGVTASKVAIRLKLVDLVPEAQQMVRGGSLPIGFYPSLHGLDANRQRLALQAWADSDGTLNWWQFDAFCKARLAEQNQGDLFSADSFLQTASFVLAAKETRTPTAALRALIAEMSAALEAVGAAPELVAKATELAA